MYYFESEALREANEELMGWFYDIVCRPNTDQLTEEEVSQLDIVNEGTVDENGNDVYSAYSTLTDLQTSIGVKHPQLYQKILHLLAGCYNTIMITRFEECEQLLRTHGFCGTFLSPNAFEERVKKYAKHTK